MSLLDPIKIDPEKKQEKPRPRGATPDELRDRGYSLTQKGTLIVTYLYRHGRGVIVLALRENYLRAPAYDNPRSIPPRVLLNRIRWVCDRDMSVKDLMSFVVLIHEEAAKSSLVKLEAHIVITDSAGHDIYQQLRREFRGARVDFITPKTGGGKGKPREMPIDTGVTFYERTTDEALLQIDSDCGNIELITQEARLGDIGDPSPLFLAMAVNNWSAFKTVPVPKESAG